MPYRPELILKLYNYRYNADKPYSSLYRESLYLFDLDRITINTNMLLNAVCIYGGVNSFRFKYLIYALLREYGKLEIFNIVSIDCLKRMVVTKCINYLKIDSIDIEAVKYRISLYTSVDDIVNAIDTIHKSVK
jgi:hypothetical protein